MFTALFISADAPAADANLMTHLPPIIRPYSGMASVSVRMVALNHSTYGHWVWVADALFVGLTTIQYTKNAMPVTEKTTVRMVRDSRRFTRWSSQYRPRRMPRSITCLAT